MDDLEIHRLRFFKLANGLMSIAYIAFIVWVLVQLYNMI